MKAKFMVARFPYGGTERTETVDWLIYAYPRLLADPRVESIASWKLGDTPITMSRNRAMKDAKEAGVDFLLMIDSDMAPDVMMGADPAAKPFLDVALDFAFSHGGPMCIGVPYCGPPPRENVYVFRWRGWSTGDPDPNLSLEQYTREEAASLGGVQRVSALPTGLILIDMRCYDVLRNAKIEGAREAYRRGREVRPKPFFYYEWKDPDETDKGSTEDVTCTRDLDLAGIPQYCAWDSWAGHVKTKVVTKPQVLRPDCVADEMHRAIVNRLPRHGEKLVTIGGNGKVLS